MDEGLLRLVNALARDPTASALGIFFSSPWLPALVWTPLALYWLWRRRWVVLLSVVLPTAGADLVNARLFKPLVARERPCRALEGLERPVRCNVGRSFASSHAAVSFAFLSSAAPALPYGWILLTPIALLVSGSRVLLGVHYPSDVAAGALLGLAFGSGASLLRRRAHSAQGAASVGAERA